MDSTNHKSILLTAPDGVQSHLLHKSESVDNADVVDKNDTTTTTPVIIEPKEYVNNQENEVHNSAGVQFDAEQIERGRSRIKKRGAEANANGARTVGSLSRSRSRSRSFSRSRSRSRSRNSSIIRDEEFLKWTVLRQDPSMRLSNLAYENNDSEDEEEDDDLITNGDRAVTEQDDDDDDDDDDDEEEESDEEQVSDIENDAEIDEKFNYDLGMKVLPNFCVSINEVLESAKPWIAKYEESIRGKEKEGIEFQQLNGGYLRAYQLLTKGKGSSSNNGDSYILYTDISSESVYALTYLMGTMVNNGDTVYIVHWDSDKKDFVSDSDLLENMNHMRKHVMHMFDCISALIDDIDVVIMSLTHPYPKHLLSEMINGLQPVALVCSLSMILSGLHNFVCSVPTFVIRKKLKRAKKKGIFD